MYELERFFDFLDRLLSGLARRSRSAYRNQDNRRPHPRQDPQTCGVDAGRVLVAIGWVIQAIILALLFSVMPGSGGATS